MKLEMVVNEEDVLVEVDNDMPLLWVLRDFLHLTGTKYGCGKGICGACSVFVEGQLYRSCIYPAALANGKSITTIEGISKNGERMHPVQKAWIDENVVQCGYCQPGFIMSTIHLINNNPNPTTADINMHLSNICRCGTYPRILSAINRIIRNEFGDKSD